MPLLFETSINRHIELKLIHFVVMCPMLCPPKFGTIYISDRSVGSTLEYSCDRVYKLVGPNNRTCKADGTWDKNEPVCILAAGKFSPWILYFI